MKDTTIRCDNCRFYESISDYEGRCKRFPPVPIDASGYIDRPITSRNDWCGEFKTDDTSKRASSSTVRAASR